VLTSSSPENNDYPKLDFKLPLTGNDLVVEDLFDEIVYEDG